MTKRIDMEELKRLYAQSSYGLTDMELAEKFGVDRTAIYKCRLKLEAGDVPLTQTERGRYKLDREKFISHIRVNQSQAMVLYLATRHLSRNTRLAKQTVQDALDKLALALYKPMTERLVKAAANVIPPPDSEIREALLKQLIEAWMEQSKIRIWYRSLKSDQVRVHGVSPYLIEPSPWSDSIYFIGYSDVTESLIPFKIERIEKAMLTSEPFIAYEGDEDTLFDFAWGIWHSEKPPDIVKLRFTGREATRRLQESIWHPLQKIEPQDDGSYLWSAPISEWREMLPFVRSWGSDVEVLAPKALRLELMREAKRLVQLYHLENTFIVTLSDGDENYDDWRATSLFRR